MALAQLVNCDLELLLLDVVVLFVLGASGKALPRQTAAQKVEQHVADRLQVVPARLLVTNMRVDTRVSGSSGQVLALAEGNMFTIGVLVTLGETEIDDEYVVLVVVSATDQEVVGLDISVNDSLLVNLLNSLYLIQIT